MALVNNPYYYHPSPVVRQVADDVFCHIAHHPEWDQLFDQGKMLGLLIVSLPERAMDDASSENAEVSTVQPAPSSIHYLNNIAYLVAYSGVVNGLDDPSHYFVPPIYDLQRPDDFYLQKDRAISDINLALSQLSDPSSPKAKQLRRQRRELSVALQNEIFSHFNFINASGLVKNVVGIFADAGRGLPPGGTGECAAPRLLQYAYRHHLVPVEVAELWYGRSPSSVLRIHRRFYPSCIEKCSPILRFMAPELAQHINASASSIPGEGIKLLYEDDYLVAVHKPAGLLSVPPKDVAQPNVEAMLHQLYPEVKGPMLVHRLDQATSGILLAAKDAATFKALQLQFVEKTVRKRYLARLKGRLSSRCGIISLPLTVNPDERPRQVVDFQFGKAAVTYYEQVDDGLWGDAPVPADETLLVLYPLTGRTHQLRVHCVSPLGLDCAITGDALYDTDPSASSATAPRLMLHAERISFVHPVTRQPVVINDPLAPRACDGWHDQSAPCRRDTT